MAQEKELTLQELMGQVQTLPMPFKPDEDHPSPNIPKSKKRKRSRRDHGSKSHRRPKPIWDKASRSRVKQMLKEQTNDVKFGDFSFDPKSKTILPAKHTQRN